MDLKEYFAPIHEEALLAMLPLEIWTECASGQALLKLAREGRCKHVRMNSTLGRFEPLSFFEWGALRCGIGDQPY